MTISSTVRKAGPFSGTGAQTSFPFSFKVFSISDVLVIQTDGSGIEQPLALGTNYTVALNADQDAHPGGTVSLSVALPAGQLLTVSSSVPLTQGASIPNMGGFYPRVIEQALDKLTIAAQQTADAAGRSLRFAFSDTNQQGTLPTCAVRSGKFLAFDAGGNPVAASGTGADAALRTDLASLTGGSSLINFAQGGIGARPRTVLDELRDTVSVKQFGAVGDGVADDSAGLNLTKARRAINLPAGRFRMAAKVDFQPNPATLTGSASGSTIVVADAATKTALRFGAVGSNDRQVTKISGLSFESEVVGGTGIDAQAVFPLFLDTVRFYRMGGHALKLFQIYYGRYQNVLLRDSGLDFVNVNNFSIDGGDISGMDDSTSYAPTDFGSVLNDCDSVSFHNLTFETWRKCGALRMVDCKNVAFNSVWFEANTCDNIVQLEQSTSTQFNSCFLELYPSPVKAFLRVDNNNTIGTNRKLVSNVVVRGGQIRLNMDWAAATPFMEAAAGSKGAVSIDGATIDSGHLFVRGDTRLSVRNVTLSSATEVIDKIKTFCTTPHAQIGNRFNSWVPNSVQADWDFANGPGFTEKSGTLAVTVTSAAGEFMTGTRGVKVSNIPSNGTRYVIEKAMQDLGPVTTEGDTHLIFVRFKPTVDMSIQFAVEGFFLEYDQSPDAVYRAGRLYDFVFKTASDNTWAQGRQGYPKFHFKVNNASGAAGNLLIDRIDYETVHGDVYLP